MKRIGVVLSILAGLFFLLVLASLFTPARSSLDYEREALAIERARQLAPLDTAVAAFWRLFPAALASAGAAYGVGLGVAHLRRYKAERQPDSRGLLPVLAAQLDHVSPAALASFHSARQLEAARQPVPHHLNYSPRIAQSGGSAAPIATAPMLADELASLPTFAQLLDSGRIGRGNPMLLGLEPNGHMVSGSWLDLYSCAIGGLTGSGKSWTAVFLALQALLYDCRIVLIDPHAQNAESLAQRLGPLAAKFVCAVASDTESIRQAVSLVSGELGQRKAGKRGAAWLIIIDEYPTLQRGPLADEVASLVEELGQEGRKLGLYGLVCGQVWNARRTGGTERRDSLASAYVHRLRPAQARMLTGLTADTLPDDILELPSGEAYLLDTSGELRRVVVPHMTPADVQRVAALVCAPASDQPAHSEQSADGCAAPERAERTPEAAHIVQLFLAGRDAGQIVTELTGMSSRAGRPYMTRLSEVQATIREALRGTGIT